MSSAGKEELKEDPTSAQVDPSGMNIQLVGPLNDGRN